MNKTQISFEKLKFFALILSFILFLNNFCLSQSENFLSIAIDNRFSSLNSLTANFPDVNAEKLRVLMFDSLVKKNERFEYVGELAKTINSLGNGNIIEFVLQEKVKFQDGNFLTSADVKFTLESLFQSNSYKADIFYDVVNGKRKPQIVSIETPDAQTIRLNISNPSLKNIILANLVNIPILSKESSFDKNQFDGTDENFLIGTGAYKLSRFDTLANIAELTANNDYWQGKPSIQNIRIIGVFDANDLVSKLKSQEIDLAPMTNLSPDIINLISKDANLKVEQFNGANIQYIGFNTRAKPFDNVKIRQAIAYAIDREKIINLVLNGHARLAFSVLPEECWAYNAGTKYNFDQTKARKLLKEAGLRDKNGDGMFDINPITIKIPPNNKVLVEIAQIIQESLEQIGLPLIIETTEMASLRDDLNKGNFQMSIGLWVVGNQDPRFLFDLFASSQSPDITSNGRNRARYKNRYVDSLLSNAIEKINQDEAKTLYLEAQEIISRDVPLIPLWNPANVVVANKRVANIKVNANGDWSFIKTLTLSQ